MLTGPFLLYDPGRARAPELLTHKVSCEENQLFSRWASAQHALTPLSPLLTDVCVIFMYLISNYYTFNFVISAEYISACFAASIGSETTQTPRYSCPFTLSVLLCM